MKKTKRTLIAETRRLLKDLKELGIETTKTELLLKRLEEYRGEKKDGNLMKFIDQEKNEEFAEKWLTISLCNIDELNM